MKKLVLLLTCLFTQQVCAQIYLQNPSFEDDSLIAPCEDCVPTHWNKCGNTMFEVIYDSAYTSSFVGHLNELVPTHGVYFTALGAYNPTLSEAECSLFQELTCIVKPGKTYRFTLDYMSAKTDFGTGTQFDYHGNSWLQLVGSNDSCVTGELLFEQFDSDTAWHQVEASFSPTQEWTILWLKQKVPTNDNYTAWIDNLSPIQCLNYNEVQATTNDTSISIGACITLNATPLGAYDSAYWKTSDGAFVANGLVGIEVCPTGYTEYVACTRSIDCGQFWSYDTVRVEVPNGIPPINTFNASLSPTTGCAQTDFHLTTNQAIELDIFDLTGKRITSFQFHQGKHNFRLNELPNGVYICKLHSRQAVHTQRIVITNCK